MIVKEVLPDREAKRIVYGSISVIQSGPTLAQIMLTTLLPILVLLRMNHY